MTEATIKTTCPYCGVGCGIEAEVIDAKKHIVNIQGDPKHPSNFGKLCSKGAALGDTVTLENRLLYPEIHGQQTDWDTALNHVASSFNSIIAEYGPDAVAFYVCGQLLTEDYYVANKLMKGFIGSANIDTNSRLCMSSAVVGYKRALGADAVPCNYEDLEQAELIILVGSNAAWCHPVTFQRIRKAKETNPALKIVIVDPRITASSDIADLHLSIKPGMDALLFNGLLVYLDAHNYLDRAFIKCHTEAFSDALAAAQSSAADIAAVAAGCCLPAEDVQQLFDWFTKLDKVVTVYSQGINQSSSGSDKCNAIINCHLATGKIGKPGMGPFSFTGQPNAMGGREVGGLANMLAAHMDLGNPEHVDRLSRFWNSHQIAVHQGLKAVELFDAIAAGQVKAVWIMATNPVVSMPDADKVKQALQQCQLVVVSDCIANTDTVQLAHVKFPATGWSEKDGTVTNLERRISRQRALFAPSGQAKPDWWIITQVGQRMGFSKAFAYQANVDIFREHAALSGFENNRKFQLRAFDISAFADINQSQYDALSPVQWPVTKSQPFGTPRLFHDGYFYTDNGKAQFIAITPRSPANAPNYEFPFILNTGRLRDQWQTMTRTGLSAKLNSHYPEPVVEIHPDDALRHNLSQDGLAKIETICGKMLARVDITSSQQAGSLFVPIHWSEQFCNQGRVGVLVNPVIDPLSGQPEYKQTPVRISPWPTYWQAMVISRRPLSILGYEYQVKIKGENHWRYQLAGQAVIVDVQNWSREFLYITNDISVDLLEYQDLSAGNYRVAQIVDQQLQSCVFFARNGQLPKSDWLCTLFDKTELSGKERFALLSGLPPQGDEQTGRTICSCFSVGEQTILQTIKSGSLVSISAIGERLGAGTGCGSCLPELKQLLKKASTV